MLGITTHILSCVVYCDCCVPVFKTAFQCEPIVSFYYRFLTGLILYISFSFVSVLKNFSVPVSVSLLYYLFVALSINLFSNIKAAQYVMTHSYFYYRAMLQSAVMPQYVVRPSVRPSVRLSVRDV